MKKKKRFDSVELMREARQRLEESLGGMSDAERIAYLKRKHGGRRKLAK